ncbi:MAG: 16S rRNA (cytidine(1402)-2'-O)-methyltransferase [Eubacterium sp.]|nr:16S rRNA (cytidine(1402)-2'-O)-methyltransferase [Eubacterium sp.]
MAGKLILCATPIGNLEDISMRAVRALREADVIAAEDTRNSIRLLNHFDIHTPMTSYHEYNKYEKGRRLVERMLKGETVALITDAGTPGISDPGEELAVMAWDAGVAVTAVPGPAAVITALTISGLPTRRFVFEAFLPRENKERREVLEELRQETRTIVLYEAPHHLRRTLDELRAVLGGDRRVSLCRELTKLHETVIRTTLDEAAAIYEAEAPRGEYVLVLAGKPREEIRAEAIREWEKLTPAEHMDFYTGQGMDRKEAMKRVAADRGVSKKEIYRALLEDR